MNRKTVFVVVCAWLLIQTHVFADTIHLQNGETIRGTIISQDAKSIRVKTGGKEQVILKSTVRRITYDEKKTPEQEAEEEKLAKEKEEREAREREKAEAEKRDQLEKLTAENERLKAEARAQQAEQKRASEDRRIRAERSGWSSIWRSLVLPGWGQAYRGDQPRAAGLMVAAGLSAYYVYTLGQEYRTARRTYSDAQSLALLTIPGGSSTAIYGAFTYANAGRNEMHRKALNANFAAALLLATYAFSGADALFYRSEAKRTLAESVIERPQSQTTLFAATLRF